MVNSYVIHVPSVSLKRVYENLIFKKYRLFIGVLYG